MRPSFQIMEAAFPAAGVGGASPNVESYAVSRSDTGDLSYTATLPSGIVSGNFLLLFVVTGSDNASVGTPSGWTQLRTETTTGGTTPGGYTDALVSVFYKVASGSEGATVSGSLGGYSAAACFTVRVAGGVSVSADSAIVDNALITGTHTQATPSVSNPSASLLLIYKALVSPGGTWNFTFGSGTKLSQSDDANSERLSVASLALSSSGSTGNIDAVATLTPSYWVSIGVAGQVVIASS